MNLSDIEGILRRVTPEAAASFLIRRGYSRRGRKGENIDVYVDSSDDVLLLPLDQDASTYANRLRDLAELFRTENMSLDDVVGSIVLPDSDIFRYRIESPETAWGHMRLSYTHEAIHALYDLLKFTAAGVSTRRTDYRAVSELAKGYADQCHFGQTEYGSFVLKVFCPTNPIVVNRDPDEPFGRISTRAVLENLDFLASDKSEDPTEPLPPTLNRQVASAVERLRPRITLGVSTEVRVRFSPFIQSQLPEDIQRTESTEEVATLNLGPFIYSRAQSVRDRLKKAEEFEREILRGYITNLHKDRPQEATEQSHEITLDIKYGFRWRQLRLRLLPAQYRQALLWQDHNLQVDVDAVVDKRSNVWSVSRLIAIHPADRTKESPGLFDDRPPSL